ncbi:DUF5954 family protein [Streptomyces sp. URMC 129]|uniref:DUF5954 family protein n=1 Tax=Streptomyces sp. URMC 129 TaxID=3423407 RepID=UPI003F1AC07A
MSDDEAELLEPHRVIRMTRFDDPVSVIADTEAWQARDEYPDIRARGPLFVVCEQEPDGRWRVLTGGELTPQNSRDLLARTCLIRARDAKEAGDEDAWRLWSAAAERMDWEKLDELVVADSRFRIVRGESYIRTGPRGPEPPRPSDADAMPIGKGNQAPARTEGFLIDPAAATGVSEGILKFDLLQFVYAVGSVPHEMRSDALRAQRTHPGGVLMPPAFAVMERVGSDGRWQAFSLPSDTPQAARDGLAVRFVGMLPARLHPPTEPKRPVGFEEWPEELRNGMAEQSGLLKPGQRKLTEEQLQALAGAAARLRRERLDEIEVLDRTFRVSRLERLLRVGPDGPEPPRPHDFDPDLPPAAQVEEDRKRGIVYPD